MGTVEKESNSVRLDVILVWGCLLLSSWCRTPIPSINEPHYLTKARQYADAAWCAGDFFLESSDVQTVYFQLLGPIAKRSLFWAAVVGRVTGYGLLALGWTLFVRTLLKRRFAPVIALCLLLGMVAIGNFSGEWLVGGIESKVYSYGFVFLSLAGILKKQPQLLRSGAWCGAAILLHPVVGMWHLLGLAFGNLFQRIHIRQMSMNTNRLFAPAIRFGIPCLLIALPGLVPAIQVVTNSEADGEVRATGNYLQVFGRLKHHLDPLWIHAESWGMYALLMILFVALRWRFVREDAATLQDEATNDSAATDSCSAINVFHRYVMATALFAIVGVFVGLGPRPASQMFAWQFRTLLLKFYPFRLFDLMLPIACVIGVLSLARFGGEANSDRLTGPDSQSSARRRWLSFLAVAAFSMTLIAPYYDRHPDRLNAEVRTDWHDACDWIRNNLPQNVLVMTPSRNFGFKWYAERPEFVSYKDCPQDALGIVEWNRRLWFMQNWASDNYDDKKYSREEINLLAAEGITHVVAKRLGPMENVEPIYRNNSYRIFEVPANSGQ